MSAKRNAVLNSVGERSFNPQETMQWLKLNPLWFMTWGARNFTNFEDKIFFFRVSGNKHKGYVVITLAWDDTYVVRLFSTQWNEKAKFDNVYCDELASLIDENIERIDLYVR